MQLDYTKSLRYPASAQIVRYAKPIDNPFIVKVYAFVRLGCFYANAFSKAEGGRTGCRSALPTGGFRRISGRVYRPLDENGSLHGVNVDGERCDGYSAATGLGNARQIAIPAVPACNGAGRHHA